MPPPFNLNNNVISKKAASSPISTTPKSSVAQKQDPAKKNNDISLEDISISGSVGKKGDNQISDVKKIQERLKYLGFLSDDNYKTENTDLFAKKKDTEKIKEASISETINAIKAYEATVEYVGYANERKKPSGKIVSKGNSLKLMNVHLKNPETTEIEAIKVKRKAIDITTLQPAKLDTLTGEIGNVAGGNKTEDLLIIQNTLIKFGFLSFNDKNSEKPDAIIKRFPDIYKDNKDNINKEHLALTIKGIKKFQTKRVKHWKDKKIKNRYKKEIGELWKGTGKKEAALTNTDMTSGVIKKDDATFIVLKAYRNHILKFKVGEEEQTYKFRNAQKSGDAINLGGFSILGKAKSANIDLETIKKFGLSDVQSKALKYVSTHEGNFDAINTYDRAVISYGFIQFAGGGRSFNKLLVLIKKDHPAKFKEKFGDYGIDVEYLEKNGAITKATTVATDTATGKKLRGVLAEDYIRKNVELVGSLIMAGHDSDIQEGQIKLAAMNYVKPANNFKFRNVANVNFIKAQIAADNTKTIVGDTKIEKYKESKEYKELIKTEKGKKQITSGKLSLGGKLIKEVLNSVKATTVIINMAINDGVGGTPIKVSKGVRDYAIENNISTIDALKTASEKNILKKIQPHAFKPKRVKAIIDDDNL